MLDGVRTGTTSLSEVFARQDAVTKRTKVIHVLLAVPGYGPAKVTAVMAACRVPENRRVGGLTERERHRLLDAVVKP
jgi:hypothetical protein